jgi:hypothetical protein
MIRILAAAALAMAMIAAPAQAQSFQPPAQGWGQEQNWGQTQNWGQSSGRSNVFGASGLSSCMRNALIGAGVGAVLGGVIAKDGKLGKAAIGGALGGVGTYVVCRYLGNRDRSRIEGGYLSALNSSQPFATSFASEQGLGLAGLAVSRPIADPRDANCQLVSASLSLAGLNGQALPQERFCRTAQGWKSAPLGY